MNFFKKFAINCLYYCGRILKPQFIFQGKKYFYFLHPYNMTWRNERAIEVPIVWSIIQSQKPKSILEIGNVLSHYFPYQCEHDIVDKYEKISGVINQDIINFRPTHKYDLIVSISTFEHIGWDEPTKDENKIVQTITNLKNNCLLPGGNIIITAPLGYNHWLDKLIKNNKLGFNQQYFFKRTSNLNTWKEVAYSNVTETKYASPYCFANAIIIGVIE